MTVNQMQESRSDSKQRLNFDIEGIIRSPNTNIKMHAIGYHQNLKKMKYLNSTSRAPAVTNSMSTMSPMRARKKADVNASLTIDVDTPHNLMSLMGTPQAMPKTNKNRESTIMKATASDFPRI